MYLLDMTHIIKIPKKIKKNYLLVSFFKEKNINAKIIIQEQFYNLFVLKPYVVFYILIKVKNIF